MRRSTKDGNKEKIMKKRFVPLLLILALFGSLAIGSPSSSDQRRRALRRAVVVVHKGFPIHRIMRPVSIHPLARPYRVVPRVFLPLVTWSGLLIATVPARNLVVWEDGESLASGEEWTEFTLNCENTGRKLWLEVVKGKVRFDWAEVVYANGEVQVVEMSESLRDPGHYLLLDFAGGREVDHVRMVAKAETPEARVVLKMEK
jgi:hypothetical protein